MRRGSAGMAPRVAAHKATASTADLRCQPLRSHRKPGRHAKRKPSANPLASIAEDLRTRSYIGPSRPGVSHQAAIRDEAHVCRHPYLRTLGGGPRLRANRPLPTFVADTNS